MEDSILKTIRNMIGPSASYEVFDADLIISINSAFSRLCQLGIGPTKPFKVIDDNTAWTEFMPEEEMPDEVKQYIYLKTRIIFDPPESATVMNAYKEQIAELEWTMKEVAHFGY